MLKIIFALMANFSTLETDIESVVREVRDAPNGGDTIKNVIDALRKLATDIENTL